MPTEALMGVVLAGGKSRRLGFDKTELSFFAERPHTVLERNAGLLACVCAAVWISGKKVAGWNYVPDDPPGCGPMGGIASALRKAGGSPCLVLAGDLPFIDKPQLMQLLRFRVHRPPGTCVTAFQSTSGRIETLAAIYEAHALPFLLAAINKNLNAIRLALPVHARHLLIYPESDEHYFLNINTSEDLLRARARLAKAFY